MKLGAEGLRDTATSPDPWGDAASTIPRRSADRPPEYADRLLESEQRDSAHEAGRFEHARFDRGLASVVGALCLSDPAMAQNRNKVIVKLHNPTDHDVTYHDVRVNPQAKNWDWDKQTIPSGGIGTWSGYCDDDQAPSIGIKWDGYSGGKYSCHHACSVEFSIPHYVEQEGQEVLVCPQNGPDTPTPKTTIRTCGNMHCEVAGTPYWNKDTCNYQLDINFREDIP